MFPPEISSGERVKEMELAGPVCVYVCPSIFASGARTAGRIGTGEYSFDAPERRKDDGNSFELIGCTWYVPRAIAQTFAKKL